MLLTCLWLALLAQAAPLSRTSAEPGCPSATPSPAAALSLAVFSAPDALLHPGVFDVEPNNPNTRHDFSSGGTVAGIVIGCIFGAALLGSFVAAFIQMAQRWFTRHARRPTSMSERRVSSDTVATANPPVLPALSYSGSPLRPPSVSSQSSLADSCRAAASHASKLSTLTREPYPPGPRTRTP